MKVFFTFFLWELIGGPTGGTIKNTDTHRHTHTALPHLLTHSLGRENSHEGNSDVWTGEEKRRERKDRRENSVKTLIILQCGPDGMQCPWRQSSGVCANQTTPATSFDGTHQITRVDLKKHRGKIDAACPTSELEIANDAR